ncbi:carbohydrate porin [Sphingomonadaceae bacterium]|nr:carbohydrate porin [Sphingomonadaceae bacterium]
MKAAMGRGRQTAVYSGNFFQLRYFRGAALIAAAAFGCPGSAFAESATIAPLAHPISGDETFAAAFAPYQRAQPAGGSAPAPVEPASLPSSAPKKRKTDARLVWTQFVDSPISGDAASTVRYGGKVDAYLRIPGAKFGLDDSWTLSLHPEFRYGETSNGEIGLLPTNTQLFYPAQDGEVFDLSASITKHWRSGTSLTVGKVNVLDIAERLPVVGGGGQEGFMNLAMALPPSAIVPASLTGVLLNVPTEKVTYRFWVYDPALESRKTGFEDPFDSGVGFLASITVNTKFGGKNGYYALKVAGSTRDSVAADALPAALIPGPNSAFGRNKGEISAILAGAQYLVEYPESPGSGIGLFGQVYLSNGDPTFLDASGFAGISGNPRSRPQDRFGIAYFRYSLTDGLVRELANRLALEDEEGVEMFYTAQVVDAVRVTADVQVVDSAVAARRTGVTASLRIKTTF